MSRENQPYHPSNGTEGMMFEGEPNEEKTTARRGAMTGMHFDKQILQHSNFLFTHYFDDRESCCIG